MSATAAAAGLSDRQVAVVRGIADGKTYREIAEALGVSYETVRTHVTKVRNKLNTRTKSGISAWAVRNGVA